MSEDEIKNIAINEAFSEIDKKSGETVTLTPNTNNTVQPVALMRLGLFVPTLKSTARGRKGQIVSMDASAELKQLSLAKAEGYEDIRISGIRLDMDNDFKTWVGIIHAFAKHKVVGDTVTLPFVEFVKLCGIPTARSSAKLRKRLDSSLSRIATNTISFRSKDSEEFYVTHLVQTAKYSTKNDTVELKADPKLFELYQFDKKVLLQLRAINELSRKESAQALYTFIESLPPDPAPISLARLRARLNLTSRIITQNAIVRKAMTQLKEIGYLDFTELKRGKTVYFIIHYRRPKLRPAQIPSIVDIDEVDDEDILKDLVEPQTEEKGKMVMLSKEELLILNKLRKTKLSE
ncbi:replication protein RepA [Escherichia coli]|uniref:replication protein RepA n=2 Tax=Escherichia coli TaxID=562 RepID=UPI000589DE04|nr:replication protein RepA [Escherichia coli]EAC1404769.1 replication protein RepA [Escherichia coli]EEW6031722.1 replication protein RepA [Escherichia coli]EFC4873279.1 replication protein RepA [Escherichia coli]EFN9261667.1 replication protein RepA [Escherichia coli]EGK3604508.1 replication protein RepA [Escherichia coli]